MSFKLFIIPAAILSILYGLAMTSMAHAETVTVTVQLWSADCALVDDTVECDISSQYGISNVHVFMNSGIGDVTVLDRDFRGCPTEVHVSLDPVVISVFSEMDVTTCGIVIPCDGCSVEVCLEDMKCSDALPDPAVSEPDPLPLKFQPAQPSGDAKPVARLSAYVSAR